MSAPEQQQAESRSSVKITLNAKGETQIEVKAYVGETDSDLIDARERAIFNFEQTLLHFSTSATPPAGHKVAA